MRIEPTSPHGRVPEANIRKQLKKDVKEMKHVALRIFKHAIPVKSASEHEWTKGSKNKAAKLTKVVAERGFLGIHKHSGKTSHKNHGKKRH